MEFINTEFEGLFVIKSSPLKDERGSFSRIFCKRELKQVGIDFGIAQVNLSKNLHPGIIRGMHFQRSPSFEMKVVNCIRGKIFDVVVDLRENSPTFLRHFTIELEEKSCQMLLVPAGFAHGFQTLEANTEILYYHSDFYAPDVYDGLNPMDPKLNIKWPLSKISLSEQDKKREMINSAFKGLRTS